MIGLSKVLEIKRLLATGMSYRQIARRACISRETVSSVAKGTHAQLVRLENPPVDEELDPRGPRTRCGGCGGLVIVPCQLCRIRDLIEREARAIKRLRAQAQREALRRLLLALYHASLERERAAVSPGAPIQAALPLMPSVSPSVTVIPPVSSSP